jgi:hypothetical protein
MKLLGLASLSLFMAVTPFLGFGLTHSYAITSPQILYPNFDTSSGCGFGLQYSAPSFGLEDYSNSSFSMRFCGTANQTLDLTNATLAIPFDIPFSSQNVHVVVKLSDAGTVIAQSSNTSSDLTSCCCPTLYSYSLSPVNGGEIKSGDQLLLNITVTGNTAYIDPCTGYINLTTFTLYGTSPSGSAGALSPQTCDSLLNLPLQKLAPGSKVTEYTPPSQVFTVPNVTNWKWYFAPVPNGQNPNTVALQIVNQMWSSGHGQSFTFFIGTYSGQLGVVLITDYSLVNRCSG